MHNIRLALPIIVALTVYVGLFLILLYAAMRVLKLWTPHLRRAYWRSVGAIYLLLTATMLLGFVAIFSDGCEPAIGYYFSQVIGTPFDPSVPKCR